MQGHLALLFSFYLPRTEVQIAHLELQFTAHGKHETYEHFLRVYMNLITLALLLVIVSFPYILIVEVSEESKVQKNVRQVSEIV